MPCKLDKIMEKFSQRMGFDPIRDIIQIDYISNELRNSLWSAFHINYCESPREDYLPYDHILNSLCQRLWIGFFKKPIDTLGFSYSEVISEIRNYFFKCEWFDVYNFIEFVANNYDSDSINNSFEKMCNSFLKRELSAYRFVDKTLARITDEQEISEIEEAISSADSLTPVSEHLRRSISLLSDKESPDYRNSIKESISAVEAICKAITGDEKATLGEALKKLKANVDIHPALEKAFLALYGYTSDSKGIRHSLGLTEESNLDFEDAKFMLVSCSAFINYLKEKAIKAKIKF